MNRKNITLEAFIKKCFYEISPTDPLANNWHIALLCETLERVYSGKIKRLIIAMPPRYLKSICISTAFPAWLLGMKATHKIIVASYAMPLAEKLSVDTKNILKSPWFYEFFPEFKWHRAVNSKRKFLTSQNGFRMATSVNGSLTGEGGDLLVADDPQKPLDILNAKYRDKTHNWFQNTFLSRLNNKKKGAVVVVMQRLHVDDIIGRLTENNLGKALLQECNGWHVFNLEAIATAEEPFRSIGQTLNPKMEDTQTIENIKQQMGSHFFEAQYQQNPKSSKNGYLKKNQIHFVNYKLDELTKKPIFISVDTAFKTGNNNDCTAISLWVEHERTIILFNVILKRLEYNEVSQTLRNLLQKYTVHKMLIEDKGSGTSLIQTLKREFGSTIEPIKCINSKPVRFCSVISYIENGVVRFNETVEEEAINQLLEFPNGKHDDAVDAISQFITWYMEKKTRIMVEPSIRSL